MRGVAQTNQTELCAGLAGFTSTGSQAKLSTGGAQKHKNNHNDNQTSLKNVIKMPLFPHAGLYYTSPRVFRGCVACQRTRCHHRGLASDDDLARSSFSLLAAQL